MFKYEDRDFKIWNFIEDLQLALVCCRLKSHFFCKFWLKIMNYVVGKLWTPWNELKLIIDFDLKLKLDFNEKQIGSQ